MRVSSRDDFPDFFSCITPSWKVSSLFTHHYVSKTLLKVYKEDSQCSGAPGFYTANPVPEFSDRNQDIVAYKCLFQVSEE